MIITYVIIGLTCLISYYCLNNRALFNELSHNPYMEVQRGQYYRVLSGGFLHGSMMHLGINMYVLYQFGGFIEEYFSYRFGSLGPTLYISFYVAAIIFANLGSLVRHQNNPGFSSIGASGVTSALILFYVFFDPWQMFVFPPLPAIVLAVLYIGYSHWASYQSGNRIDHQGHLWGALFGVLFVVVFDQGLFSSFLEKLMTLPF